MAIQKVSSDLAASLAGALAVLGCFGSSSALAQSPAPPPGLADAPAGSGFTVMVDQVEPRTGWRMLHSRFPLPKAGGGMSASIYGRDELLKQEADRQIRA